VNALFPAAQADPAASRPLVEIAPVRIAFLTNVYPATSHSFIRREIFALERQGFDIARFTIRTGGKSLPDPDDRRELTRTFVLLDDRRLALIGDMLALAVRRPRRFVSALRTAVRLATGGVRELPRHIAYLAEACRLVRQLEAAGIGHVHAHFGTNPAAVALLTSRLGDVTYSFTVHGPDEFDAPVSLSLGAKATGAAFVVAISSFGRGQLMRWLAPADWQRIEVVRCGVDQRFLVPTVQPSSGRTLVCVARLSGQKGLPLLVEAAAKLARTADFQLRLVGAGELETFLAAQIQRLGLAGRVTLVGPLSAADVRAEILAARALVVPSFAEGLPVVLMEALGLGRPVVTTSIAGIPELVDAGCGWVVPSGDVDQLCAAMQAALDADADTLARLGTEGRRRVARDHDVEINAARLAALLRPFAAKPAA
jgi:glycosyltransferase involved in cell wall biosynthesis